MGEPTERNSTHRDSSEALKALLEVARGDAPADLVLRGGRVLNTYTGELVDADVAIVGEKIAGVGIGYDGRHVEDVSGLVLSPGLIDAHVHIESSMVSPSAFAQAVVPRGVTTVITDPHEIANVLGLDGIRFMLEDAAGAPLDMRVHLSSCVPATHMETSGARLTADDLLTLKDHPKVMGLAEVMNFPGVVAGDPDMLAKLEAFATDVIDGHAPGLSGKALNAYIAAGPRSDHEATTVEEAREKLRLGMRVFLREATNAQNLLDLLGVLDRQTERRLCLCTDDRQPADLMDDGSVDHLVRMCIAEGVEPVTAMRMATLNTAEAFRLYDRGAVAPGLRADVVAFEDLSRPSARLVVTAGRIVARDGEMIAARGAEPANGRGAGLASRGGPKGAHLGDSMNVDWSQVDFRIPAPDGPVRVIGVVPNQLITEHLTESPTVTDGWAVADPDRDLAKIAVIDRHAASGRVGLGFVRGVGLKRGAIAGTVAHDHHNLIVVGLDDRSMYAAARAVGDAGGGLAVAARNDILGVLPLPIAGLMSDRSLSAVRDQMDRLLAAAVELGATLHDPFMAMSFLGLEVIPHLKLTDHGLVDVDAFQVVPLAVESDDA